MRTVVNLIPLYSSENYRQQIPTFLDVAENLKPIVCHPMRNLDTYQNSREISVCQLSYSKQIEA